MTLNFKSVFRVGSLPRVEWLQSERGDAHANGNRGEAPKLVFREDTSTAWTDSIRRDSWGASQSKDTRDGDWEDGSWKDTSWWPDHAWKDQDDCGRGWDWSEWSQDLTSSRDSSWKAENDDGTKSSWWNEHDDGTKSSQEDAKQSNSSTLVEATGHPVVEEPEGQEGQWLRRCIWCGQVASKVVKARASRIKSAMLERWHASWHAEKFREGEI